MIIESQNPEINVDELMEQVKQEVANRKYSFPIHPNVSNNLKSNDEFLDYFYRIESLLNNSELYSQNPSQLPQKINKFPFNIGFIKKVIFKIYEFIFKKQRVVNSELIQAFRESLQLNQQLMAKLNIIESKLNATETKWEKSLKKIDECYLFNDNFIKNDLSRQQRLITMFWEDVKKTLHGALSQEQVENFIKEEQHLLDAFYVAFENRFRGSTEAICEQLKIYLPLLKENSKISDYPIIDVGCGRGEWLQILKEEGYQGKGIDLNRVMVEQCVQKGLEAYESDIISHLNSLPNESIGVITGFHIIEHLPFNHLMKLFSETLRVLKPGGMAIFETPNSHNILVGTNNFYIDPTHLNPLPSELTQFLFEHIGFVSVKIIPLHPYKDDIKLQGTEPIIQRFNDYFYGSQDYAVIGYKG